VISNPINLTTGPVSLLNEVKIALAEEPISHRSAEFKEFYKQTTELLETHFKVRDVFLLTGSGTLANEVMTLQIKMLNKKGLILSNGEFGNRLINQASVNNLDFISCTKHWGESFDHEEIEEIIVKNKLHWVLFCHCETSTGVVNNLDEITGLCKKLNCLCYVDCISSVGCMPIDLSKVAMATASSGKGLCSMAGLAIIFTNITPVSDGSIPKYLNLKYYEEKNGIPFTISSNLIKALHAGCKLRLTESNYSVVKNISQQVRHFLNELDVLPFENYHVFTLAFNDRSASLISNELARNKILSSYQSDYLEKRNWLQIALFNTHSEKDVNYFLEKIHPLLLPQEIHLEL
jgi:aspartate aminotransferase-like enzyme